MISATIARYLLFLLNLLFLISSLLVAAAAVYFETTFWNYNWFSQPNWNSPAIIIGIIGCLTLAVSFFGFCGIVKGDRCCLKTFSVFMIIVILGEIAAAVYMYITKDQIAVQSEAQMKENMKKYNVTVLDTQNWDALQSDFKCCGYKDSSDWSPILRQGKLPLSCCPSKNSTVVCNFASAYKIGCGTKFGKGLSSQWLIIAGMAIAVGILQLLCAIASGFVAQHIDIVYQVV